MNLEVIKHYLSFLARSEATLDRNRSQLDLSRHNAFSFFKLIATKSQPLIDRTLLIAFIRTFTYNFQVQQPHQLALSQQYQLFPSQDNHSQQALMVKGVELFLKKWSKTGTGVSFDEFAVIMGDQTQIPQRPKEVDFSQKKKFYQLVQDEIQTLLDGQTFRKAVNLQYKNLVDLFELMSNNGELSIEEVRNLFLMAGQRKPENFFDKISKRIPLPLGETQFKEWFNVNSTVSKYRQQTKIFYSSLKRKKYDSHYDDEQDDRFMTPNAKTAAVGMSSTKMTKGQRLHSTSRKQEVSRLTFDRQITTSSTSILADILAEQQKLAQMKRKLLYRPDYDLQLIYEQKGQKLQEILNNRFGSCNFTSFVRYFVPQDYEHRYLAFIKQQPQNRLTPQTVEQIDRLIEEEYAKEATISNWWEEIDREMAFRGYCRPGDKQIPAPELKKYFTERECRLLLDRLDPHKTGAIAYEHFS